MIEVIKHLMKILPYELPREAKIEIVAQELKISVAEVRKHLNE